jgi:predicted transcriptional regulator
MAVKVTFTLDDVTIERLNRAAARARKPKSAVVREAIADYEAKGDRLSPAEQQRLLAIVREIRAQPQDRSAARVRRELADLRRVRRLPGRLHPVD